MTAPASRSRPPRSLSRELPNRADFHLRRKFFHFSTGLVFALANQNLSRPLWPLLSLFVFTVVFTIEVLRIRAPSGSLNAFVLKAFRPFIRSHETHQFAGIAYYTFGVSFVSTVFPRTSSTLAILLLASLDPVAAFAGSLFQSSFPSLRLSHGKSLAGLVCSCAVATAVSFCALTASPMSSLHPPQAYLFSVLVATAGAVTEFLIPSPQFILGPQEFPIAIDDNAVIPIVTAAVTTFLFDATWHKVELSPLLLF